MEGPSPPRRWSLTATDRRILRLAVPALGSLAVEPLYVLVDTAIVGRLGTAQLGGLAIAATVLTLVVTACNFLTYGTTERVARRLGAGDPAAAADVGVQAVWVSVFVGLIAAPVIAIAAPLLVELVGADDDVVGFALTYLRVSAVAVPFIVFTLAAQGVLRGAAEYRTPLAILVVANVANAVLEPIFVFGLDLGVPGSAWSTVICQVGAGLAFARAVWPRLRQAEHRRPDREGMAPLLSAGRHLLLRVGSMLAVSAGTMAIAARIDAATLAANQIAASMLSFLALVLDALAIPAQTLVAEDLGGDDVRAARDVSDRSCWLSIVAGAVLAGAVAVSAPWLPHLFTGDDAVVSLATTALLLLAAALVPAAIAFAYDGVLIGAGDYRFLGLAALCYLLAVTPIGIAILLSPSAGIAAIWFGILAWMLMRAVVNHLRARRLLAVRAA